MKFIIDAQLPKSLSDFLSQIGHEALHTRSLPDKNRTTDSPIIEISVKKTCCYYKSCRFFVVILFKETAVKA